MSEGSTDPTPETMAREAGYIEGSAMERAFCTGVDTERLRQGAAVLAERERGAKALKDFAKMLEHEGDETAEQIIGAAYARTALRLAADIFIHPEKPLHEIVAGARSKP